MKITKNNQFGRSMVEMLGVLAIIGVLSIGGIAGYSKAMEKHKINKTIDEINTTLGNVLMLVHSSNFKDSISCSFYSTTTAENCDTIQKLNIVPEHMWKNSTQIVTSTGHPAGIAIKGYNVGLSKYQMVGFHLNNEESVNAISDNKNLCISLLTTDWTDLNISTIDGDPYTFVAPEFTIDNPEYEFYIPLSIADAEKICSNKEKPIKYMWFTIKTD